MTIILRIKEKFELPDGVTVLACTGGDSRRNVIGKQFSLTSEGEVKQRLSITGERKMLNMNKNTNADLRAFETSDAVLLSSDEIRNGNWNLVGE